jgi:hypothetical protein
MMPCEKQSSILSNYEVQHPLHLPCFDVAGYASPHPAKSVACYAFRVTYQKNDKKYHSKLFCPFAFLAISMSPALYLHLKYITSYQFCISFYFEGAGIAQSV